MSGEPNFFLHISFSWVEIILLAEFEPLGLPRSGRFMVGETKKKTRQQVSTKLIASLAPARAEIEAGVVAKADQYGRQNQICQILSMYFSLISLKYSLFGFLSCLMCIHCFGKLNIIHQMCSGETQILT